MAVFQSVKTAFMKACIFSVKSYDREFFAVANLRYGHQLVYLESHLNEQSAALATGFEAVCPFVNDHLNRATLGALRRAGVRFLALRSAGFNHVDLVAARELGLRVARVPRYSPYAVAEHTIGLMLALNRKLFRAYNRVREGNFSLEGLMGFDMNQKVAGVVGTGAIGAQVAKILTAFGCRVLAVDPYPSSELTTIGVRYVSLEELLKESDIVTLHCPLTASTRHVIDAQAVERMKPSVMLINTGRGALVDTPAVIRGLKSGKIGAVGLDVYEEEDDLFFDDQSANIIQDDLFTRLLTFPNVFITGHQAFFTREAMHNIADTTLQNLRDFEAGAPFVNEIR